jgi:putative ABC transport system substrate-binding protein
VGLVGSFLTIQHREYIIKGLAAHKVPVIGGGREMPEVGAVLAYSPDVLHLWKRSATYVDKLLKGARPDDLPIEEPTKFELIVNAKAARALGMSIPESILLRADEVIR